MGRKTFESIGRVLDGRDIIVVTRQADFPPPASSSLEPRGGARACRERARGARRGRDLRVGGGEIYREALPLADRLYVTHVARRRTATRCFPEISPADWIEVSREPLPPSEGDTATAEHVVYATTPLSLGAFGNLRVPAYCNVSPRAPLYTRAHAAGAA